MLNSAIIWMLTEALHAKAGLSQVRQAGQHMSGRGMPSALCAIK